MTNVEKTVARQLATQIQKEIHEMTKEYVSLEALENMLAKGDSKGVNAELMKLTAYKVDLIKQGK
jgi:predicted DNA-binding protein